MNETDRTAQPFAGLSPDVVIEALERLGFECDGRLFALNSYENRVYQVGVPERGALVLKFYRPGRWSDARGAAWFGKMGSAGMLRFGGSPKARFPQSAV